MALRKDKVAEALRAMKGICSSPNDPTSLPDALGQLADILGNVFDDIALPDLPPISTGEFGFPEDATFDFPLGGGEMMFFDPLDGFGGQPPSGDFGDPGGGGGEGGPAEEQNAPGDPGCSVQLFVAKSVTEIGASENATPGIGYVKIQSLQPEEISEDEWEDIAWFGLDKPQDRKTEKDFVSCKNKCAEEIFGAELDELGSSGDAEFLGITQEEGALSLMKDCLDKCFDEMTYQDDDSVDPIMVQNISCEKIEKDKTLIVSWDQCTNDAYVIVEACGCCE